MAVISFTSSKGGSGKTTAVILLATTLAQQLKVTIIDADKQESIVYWASQGNHSPNISVIACADERKIQRVIKEAEAKSDVVIVDTQGAATRLNTFVIGKSTLVIVPTSNEQQEARSAIFTLSRIEEDSEMLGREIPSRVLITNTKPGNNFNKPFQKSINSQLRGNTKCFEVELKQRDQYPMLQSTGGSLYDLPEKERGLDKAKVNAEAFAAEVTEVIAEVLQAGRVDA